MNNNGKFKNLQIHKVSGKNLFFSKSREKTPTNSKNVQLTNEKSNA